MGILEILTIVFVVLKLTHQITWSWWLVLLPEIIGVGLYITISIIHAKITMDIKKEQKRLFDRKWNFNK